MRDCVFLLADKNMQATFKGFLTRTRFCRSLGCGEFDFDPCSDLHVAAGDNDPGLYTRGHELLRPFRTSHRHAVVVLDAEWNGSPGKDEIAENITARIAETGWSRDHFVVIVIAPELENWIWQKNDNVARSLGYSSQDELMADTDLQEAWPQGQAKPCLPKEIMELLLRKRRIPRSSSIYQKISSQISVRNCSDNAFLLLINKLRLWFPPSAESQEITL
jgi:hypothetical protein